MFNVRPLTKDVTGVAQAVVQAQAGDMRGHHFLYQRYADNIYSYVLTILRDTQDAEDVTQAIFTKLITIIPRYNPQKPFIAWLLRVAHNEALDHLRKQKVRATVDMPEHRHAPFASDNHGRRLDLIDALAALPADQRSVTLRYDLMGDSIVDIAADMGRSKSAVHGLHFRACKALRAKLAA